MMSTHTYYLNVYGGFVIGYRTAGEAAQNVNPKTVLHTAVEATYELPDPSPPEPKPGSKWRHRSNGTRAVVFEVLDGYVHYRHWDSTLWQAGKRLLAWFPSEYEPDELGTDKADKAALVDEVKRLRDALLPQECTECSEWLGDMEMGCDACAWKFR